MQEILDEFNKTEFWYVDQGIVTAEAGDGSAKTLKRQEEKWWLPVPRVPAAGLQETERKKLQHKRDSTNQILKAAMAINSNVLAEMEIPKSYFESLPKVDQISWKFPNDTVDGPFICSFSDGKGGAGRNDIPVHHVGAILAGMSSGLHGSIVGASSARGREPGGGVHFRLAAEGECAATTER